MDTHNKVERALQVSHPDHRLSPNRMLTKMRKVRVVPYDPAWPERFDHEAQVIARLWQERVLSIHHAGSTAVPGIRAKPIVDILVIVRDIERVEELEGPMADLGYEAWGEFHIPGRRFFTRLDGEERVINLHAFQLGNPEIERMLDFRDYLRQHWEVAQAYSRLKEELARLFPTDIDGYMAGKNKFIKDVIRLAHDWRGRLPAD